MSREEECDMCQALRELMGESMAQGLPQGITQGATEKTESLYKTCCNSKKADGSIYENT